MKKYLANKTIVGESMNFGVRPQFGPSKITNSRYLSFSKFFYNRYFFWSFESNETMHKKVRHRTPNNVSSFLLQSK